MPNLDFHRISRFLPVAGRDLVYRQTEKTTLQKKIVRYGLFYGTVPVVFLFGVKAWDWSGDHSFYSRREGWFAKDTDYAGADKAGHFYAHYVVQRSLYDIFNWTENGGNMKWAYSIGTTMGVGFLIELGDGFSSKYGFSYEDLVMDYTGILCGAVLERFPVADGFIGISSHYSPTSVFFDRYDSHSGAKPFLEFVNDYSGWNTMVNFKLAGFSNIGVHLPLALRLIQFDIGYETRGYSNYDTVAGITHREIHLCYGISLNSAQLLDESWEWERGGGYHAAHRFLEYYHVPVQKSETVKL